MISFRDMTSRRLNEMFHWRSSIVLFVACANHLLTFLAYDWYAGIDCYSYDVAGLQLLSGYRFDPFPAIYRAPLVPVLKNVLYLIFEGHPYALSIFVHSWGVATAILAYRIGKRFGRSVGLILGLVVAGNLALSVHFHHISITTVFIPLILAAFDRFCAWVKHPCRGRLALLVTVSFLCYITHPAGVILAAIFFVLGWAGHRSWRQAALFLFAMLVLCNGVGFLYYVNFGCRQVADVKGYQLFARISFAADRQFSPDNGPASAKINGYLQRSLLQRIKQTDKRTYYMSALCLAQKELGYKAADELFLRSSVEAIRTDPAKFLYYTALRFMAHFGFVQYEWLRFKETPSETPSGHMWGFDPGRMIDRQKDFSRWQPYVRTVPNPLSWERQVLTARFLNAIGIRMQIPPLPQACELTLNVKENDSGGVDYLYCSEGNMSERLWHSRALDAYYYYGYWGQRGWSIPALRLLKLWDTAFMLKPPLRMHVLRFLWIFWIVAVICRRSKRTEGTSLLAMLLFTVIFGLCVVIFSDNFGGRNALYTESLIWLGGLCGLADVSFKARAYFSNVLTNRIIDI